MNKNKHRFVPLLLSISMIVGILIGTFFTSHSSTGKLSIINTRSNKLNYLLQLIDNNYVDTVDMSSCTSMSCSVMPSSPIFTTLSPKPSCTSPYSRFSPKTSGLPCST